MRDRTDGRHFAVLAFALICVCLVSVSRAAAPLPQLATRDGRYVLTRSEDTTARIWTYGDVTPEEAQTLKQCD